MVKNSNEVKKDENNGIKFDLIVKRESLTKKETGEVINYTTYNLYIDGERFLLQPKQEDKRYLNRLLKAAGLPFEEQSVGNSQDGTSGSDLPY